MKKINNSNLINLSGGTAQMCFLVGAFGWMGYLGNNPVLSSTTSSLVNYCWNS